MAEFPDLPKLFSSSFKEDKVYDVTLVARRDLTGKHEGTVILELQMEPGVYSKKLDEMITHGELWINPPGHQWHNERDYALLGGVSGIMDGQTFKLERSGNVICIDGQPCNAPTQPSQPSPTQQATQQPRTAPVTPDGAYRGPLLKDTYALFTDCAIAAAKAAETVKKTEEIEVPEVVWGAWASTLFIQMKDAAPGYLQRKALHLAGSAPQGEDDLPF